MAVELATLGGHFFTGFDVTGGWRHRKVLERLPEMAGLGTNGTNSISHEAGEAICMLFVLCCAFARSPACGAVTP